MSNEDWFFVRLNLDGLVTVIRTGDDGRAHAHFRGRGPARMIAEDT
jgi:hypothetical protein